MPRDGVSFDQVAGAADTLVANGVSATIKSVRQSLGTGSCNTIHKHLSTWREKHQQVSTALSELPLTLSKAILQEIDRSKAEARADLEARLIVIQAEAADLAASGEALESELDQKVQEIEALKTGRDSLIEQLEGKAVEIKRLTSQIEMEQSFAEQARIEVAQLRNKLELQSEKLVTQSDTIDKLSAANSAESLAKIAAEKEVAVLTISLASEKEKSKALLTEKEGLCEQLSAERISGESVRIAAEKLKTELENKSVLLAEQISTFKELSEKLEAEKVTRIASEKMVEFQAKLLMEKTTLIKEITESLAAEKEARITAEYEKSVLASRLEQAKEQSLHPTKG